MIPLLIVFGVLLLIALLPVGAYCRYDGEALIELCIGFIRIRLVPKKPQNRRQRQKAEEKAEKKKSQKEEKKKKKKADALIQKKPKEDKPKEPLRDKIEGLLPFVRLVVELLGKVRRQFLIKNLTVYVRLGGSDPAAVGINTGRAWGIINMAMPILRSGFRIRKSDLQVSPDFCSSKTEIRAVLRIRFLLGGMIFLVLRYGFRALKLFLKRKKEQKLKKAVQQ